jgi:Flp pilus assembly protein TadD
VTATEISRLGATHAIILGGTGAVSAGVQNTLATTMGLVVERIFGDHRYQTADAVALRTIEVLGVDYDGTAFVATGANFPDALAAAPLAAAQGWPLFLAHPTGGLLPGTVAAMGAVDEAIILGGTGAVSTAVQTQLATTMGLTTTRLEGLNRYVTAVAIASYGVNSAGHVWDRVGIATGEDYPDALAGGVLQGKVGRSCCSRCRQAAPRHRDRTRDQRRRHPHRDLLRRHRCGEQLRAHACSTSCDRAAGERSASSESSKDSRRDARKGEHTLSVCGLKCRAACSQRASSMRRSKRTRRRSKRTLPMAPPTMVVVSRVREGRVRRGYRGLHKGHRARRLEDATIYYKRGVAFQSLGELDEAIDDYSRALELDPSNALAYNNRGIVWHRKDELENAIADYDRAIELDPEDAVAYNNRGLAWEEAGELDKAIDDYNRAIELDPEDATAHNNRGFVWRVKGDQLKDKAIEDFTRAIEINPSYAAAYKNRGYAWQEKGADYNAMVDFKKAEELDPRLRIE